jgi:short-subunit dehydrogenase
MICSRKGQIVFLNSTAGLRARANASQYAATKHALKAVADSLREEVNPAGVRVLSLFLGRTATPMQASVFAAERREYNPGILMQPEDVAEVVVNALALSRRAEITEITMRPAIKSY